MNETKKTMNYPLFDMLLMILILCGSSSSYGIMSVVDAAADGSGGCTLWPDGLSVIDPDRVVYGQTCHDYELEALDGKLGHCNTPISDDVLFLYETYWAIKYICGCNVSFPDNNNNTNGTTSRTNTTCGPLCQDGSLLLEEVADKKIPAINITCRELEAESLFYFPREDVPLDCGWYQPFANQACGCSNVPPETGCQVCGSGSHNPLLPMSVKQTAAVAGDEEEEGWNMAYPDKEINNPGTTCLDFSVELAFQILEDDAKCETHQSVLGSYCGCPISHPPEPTCRICLEEDDEELISNTTIYQFKLPGQVGGNFSKRVIGAHCVQVALDVNDASRDESKFCNSIRDQIHDDCRRRAASNSNSSSSTTSSPSPTTASPTTTTMTPTTILTTSPATAIPTKLSPMTASPTMMEQTPNACRNSGSLGTFVFGMGTLVLLGQLLFFIVV